MPIPAGTILREGDEIAVSATVHFVSGSTVYAKISEGGSDIAIQFGKIRSIIRRIYHVGDMVTVSREQRPLKVVAVHDDFLWAEDSSGFPVTVTASEATLFTPPSPPPPDPAPGLPDPVNVVLGSEI